MAGSPVVGLETVRTRAHLMDVRGRFSYPEVGYSGIRRSAVLVPLVMRSSGLHVLLTQRSASLRRQAGQVSFPGGAMDSVDGDELATALREAEEEVGLPRDAVEILAQLPPFFVRPNFSVMAFLAVIPSDFVPKPCQQEVALVFEVPLRDFVEKDVEWKVFSGLGMSKIVYPRYLHALQDGGAIVDIWGATGYYCILVAEVVYDAIEKFGGTIVGGMKSVEEIIDHFHQFYRAACLHISKHGPHL